MLKRLFMLGAVSLLAFGCATTEKTATDNGTATDTKITDNGIATDTKITDNGIATDTKTEVGQDTTQTCTLQASLKGKAYLIKHLYVDEPAGEGNALATTLTNLWNGDIEKGRLVIIFYVSKYDSSTGKVTLQAGTGIKDTDGKYAFIKDPGPNDLEADIVGCTFDTNVKGQIILYPNTVTAHIPIVALDAHGMFTENADAINSGSLIGGICTSDAAAIEFDPISKQPPYVCQNFKKFMDLMKLQPNRDDLTEGICTLGGTDGYDFKGRFDAIQIKNFKTDIVDAVHDFTCSGK